MDGCIDSFSFNTRPYLGLEATPLVLLQQGASYPTHLSEGATVQDVVEAHRLRFLLHLSHLPLHGSLKPILLLLPVPTQAVVLVITFLVSTIIQKINVHVS